SQRYFGDGRLTPRRFEKARVGARQLLEPVQQVFRRRGWDSATGSSGTARTVLEACREINPKVTAITAASIDSLIEALCEAGRIDAIPFQAVTADRRNVLPGGVAILAAVFSQLKIK